MDTTTAHPTRSLQQWLDEYGESHTNATNRALHKICVPLIFWSLLGMMAGLQHWAGQLMLNIVCIGGLYFYGRLSFKVFIAMLVVLILCMWSYNLLLAVHFPLFVASLGIFAVAWVGQFIGHKIEGRRPSFLKDLQFLLIGPLWVVYSLRTR